MSESSLGQQVGSDKTLTTKEIEVRVRGELTMGDIDRKFSSGVD